jgi:hypothetical protein
MRWTTSPRLSLELALIRATIPETDAQPHALISRVERLERLAGITATPGPTEAAGTEAEAPPAPPAEKPARKRQTRGAEASSAEGAETPGPAAEQVAATPVLGAGTAAVDVTMLRASWPTLIQHLRSQNKAVLPSFLEVATPAAFDGDVLELVFPPDRRFGVAKVEEREAELRTALQELFGISPVIRCVVRDSVVSHVEVLEEDPPLSEEEALARLTAELGAQPTTEGP